MPPVITSGWNTPVYGQPGPRDSASQLRTQLATGPVSTGKRTGLPQRPPIRLRTQPFTPTSTNQRGVDWTKYWAKPVMPQDIGPGPTDYPPNYVTPSEPWVPQPDGSYENRQTGERLPKGARVPQPKREYLPPSEIPGP